MKLVLGTAQFGMDYGISNTSGKTPKEEVRHILKYALEQGVTLFDTASVYGDSESLLGEFLKDREEVGFITKIPRLEEDVINAVYRSLHHLNTTTLYAVLLHSSDDFLGIYGERIYSDLKTLQAQGIVKKIGVSVYSREQIESIIDIYPVDIIQMPVNIFDQRLLQDDFLSSLKERNIELHIRSIFLQGLLLMNVNGIPEYFNPVKTHFSNYVDYIERLGLTPLQAALGFANSIPEIDAIVLGVNSVSQLEEICRHKEAQINIDAFKAFALDDPTFVNPSLWNSV